MEDRAVEQEVTNKPPCRLWAVVTSSLPLRAYLFDGGVVVFGNAAPEDGQLASRDDLIVNLWHQGRRTEAPPWSVADFRSYLDNLSGSKLTFDTLWSEMQRSLGTQLGMQHLSWARG